MATKVSIMEFYTGMPREMEAHRIRPVIGKAMIT